VVVSHRGALVRTADAEVRLGVGPSAAVGRDAHAEPAVGIARIAPAPAWRAQVAP
jgi:ATP-binding cassette subfamily C protein CydD